MSAMEIEVFFKVSLKFLKKRRSNRYCVKQIIVNMSQADFSQTCVEKPTYKKYQYHLFAPSDAVLVAHAQASRSCKLSKKLKKRHYKTCFEIMSLKTNLLNKISNSVADF